ncbi:MAG: AAA family ATPase [Defluviitaleaceae bacterium]|nr:AAA family ATPase [Defluviitaleaceae bacterium]
MLKLFEVEGFKNFSHRFVLDFSDMRDYQYNEHCIKDGLLKSGIIYGKNSSGKSNFSLAVFDIVAHLTGNNVSPGLYDNYNNDVSGGAAAQFRYVFRFGEDEVDYSYAKISSKSLAKEKLILNGKTIMSVGYKMPGFDFYGTWEGLQSLAPTLNFSFYKDGSVLKYALNNTALEAEHPLYKMMDFVSRMLWFRSLGENRYIGYKTSTDDFNRFMLEDTAVLVEFQELLVMAGVEDKIVVGTNADGKKHLYSIPPKSITGSIPFFATASNGTKALYALFYWTKTAPDTSLLFIDEFDAYYHFELSETIVKLLCAMPNTQVILTSHNTNLLTNRIMRPDCLFILSPDKLTSFTNATNRELREGHNLEKLYASGEFYE